MSWKDDLTSLLETTSHLEKMMKLLQTQMALQSKKLDHLQRTVEAAEKNKGQSADRMADRLIEMAMVNKGMTYDAATHRRSLGQQTPPELNDLWQDSPETEWPPKGYDAVRMP